MGGAERSEGRGHPSCALMKQALERQQGERAGKPGGEGRRGGGREGGREGGEGGEGREGREGGWEEVRREGRERREGGNEEGEGGGEGRRRKREEGRREGTGCKEFSTFICTTCTDVHIPLAWLCRESASYKSPELKEDP